MQFEAWFENTQWRKVKQMQPVWQQHELYPKPGFPTHFIERFSFAKLLWVRPWKNLYPGILSWIFNEPCYASVKVPMIHPVNGSDGLQWWRWSAQECCPPAHLWGEDPAWKSRDKCDDRIKVDTSQVPQPTFKSVGEPDQVDTPLFHPASAS